MNEYGAAATGAAANGVFGIFSTLINNAMARKNAEIDRKQNFALNEQAAQNADYRTRALYNDLYSPKAVVQQLLAAGINPNIAAGGVQGAAGAGGGAMGGGGNAHTQTPQFNLAADAAHGALIASQAKLNEANADKAQAEADKTKGVDTQLTAAQIEETLSKAGLNEAQKLYTEFQHDLQERMKETTIEQAAQKLKNSQQDFDTNLKKQELLIEQIQKAKTENKISSATADDMIKQIQLQNQNLIWQRLNLVAQKNLTEEEAAAVTKKLKIQMAANGITRQNFTEHLDYLEKQLKEQIGLQERGQNINAVNALISNITRIISTYILANPASKVAAVAAGATTFENQSTDIWY